VIELLLDHGAGPSFRVVEPLVLAAGSGSVDSLRMLLTHDADDNSVGDDGATVACSRIIADDSYATWKLRLRQFL
jgi:hypothetical protein